MYKIVETDKEIVTSNGVIISPVLTLKDEYGGVCQIVEDDSCYVLMLRGKDGALDVIYNMLIKDKQKFIDALNRYGYATVSATIGGATMLNNKNE